VKTLSVITSLCLHLIALGARAEDSASTKYYVGESIVTMSTGEVSRSPYIIARVSAPSAGTISEAVVTRKQVGFGENKSTMTVTGNHFTLSESTGLVTGGGELTGQPWDWTFLRAEFNAPKFSLRIVDYNFFADPNLIAGHKDFYRTTESGESMYMQEDVVVYQVDQKSFEAKRKELLGL